MLIYDILILIRCQQSYCVFCYAWDSKIRILPLPPKGIVQKSNRPPVYRLLPYTASTRLFREICGVGLRMWQRPTSWKKKLDMDVVWIFDWDVWESLCRMIFPLSGDQFLNRVTGSISNCCQCLSNLMSDQPWPRMFFCFSTGIPSDSQPWLDWQVSHHQLHPIDPDVGLWWGRWSSRSLCQLAWIVCWMTTRVALKTWFRIDLSYWNYPYSIHMILTYSFSMKWRSSRNWRLPTKWSNVFLGDLLDFTGVPSSCVPKDMLRDVEVDIGINDQELLEWDGMSFAELAACYAYFSIHLSLGIHSFYLCHRRIPAP